MKPPVLRITIDGRTWDVASTPLAVPSRAIFEWRRVARPSPEVFALAPSFGARAIGFVLFAIGVTVPVLGLLQMVRVGVRIPTEDQFGAALGAIAVGAVGLLFAVYAVLIGLLLMTRSTRFDKSSGFMTQRAIFRTKLEVPLANVVAVQCLYADRVIDPGGGRGAGGVHDVYQLNLVVKNGPEPRVHVCNKYDEVWLRKTATDLAGFLGATSIDQIDQGRAVLKASRSWW